MFRVFVFFFSLLLPVFVMAQPVDPQLQQAIDETYNAHFDEAQTTVDSYIKINPTDPKGYMVRGTLNDWKQLVHNLKGSLNSKIMKDYEEASKLAFQQWNGDQENVDKMVNLGNSYMYLSKKYIDLGKKMKSGSILKSAQKYMEEALKKDPSRYDALFAMGIFNFYAANIPSGLKFLASLLGIKGNEAQGLAQLKKAASNPNILQPQALYILSYANAQSKKKYMEANIYLDQLILKYPDNPEFRHVKAEYTFRNKQYADSRKQFDNFFKFCSTKPLDFCSKEYHFLAHYFLASGYFNENKILEAKPHIEEAFQLDDKKHSDSTARLHYYKGMLHKAEGNKDAAIVEFRSIDKSKNETIWEKAQKELLALEK